MVVGSRLREGVGVGVSANVTHGFGIGIVVWVQVRAAVEHVVFRGLENRSPDISLFLVDEVTASVLAIKFFV